MVRAWCIKLLLEEVGRITVGGSYAHAFGRGDERASRRLPVSLPLEVVGPALTSGRVLPLSFPFVAVEDGPDIFFACGVAHGDVEQHLRRLRVLALELVEQGLSGGSGEECPDDVGIGDVLEVRPVQDLTSMEMLEPCSRHVGQEQCRLQMVKSSSSAPPAH